MGRRREAAGVKRKTSSASHLSHCNFKSLRWNLQTHSINSTASFWQTMFHNIRVTIFLRLKWNLLILLVSRVGGFFLAEEIRLRINVSDIDYWCVWSGAGDHHTMVHFNGPVDQCCSFMYAPGTGLIRITINSFSVWKICQISKFLRSILNNRKYLMGRGIQIFKFLEVWRAVCTCRWGSSGPKRCWVDHCGQYCRWKRMSVLRTLSSVYKASHIELDMSEILFHLKDWTGNIRPTCFVHKPTCASED